MNNKDKAKILYNLFKPNCSPTVFYFDNDGSKKPYRLNNKKTTSDFIEEIHFEGYPIGSLALRYYVGIDTASKGKIKFYNCDYDKHTEEQDPLGHIKRDISLLEDCEIEPLISLSSSGKGYHLNMFLDKEYNSEDVFCFGVALYNWRKKQGEEFPEVKPYNYGIDKLPGVIFLPKSGCQTFLNKELNPISDTEALNNTKEYSSEVFINASKTIAKKLGTDWQIFKDCANISNKKEKPVRLTRISPVIPLDKEEDLLSVFPDIGAYLAYKGYSIEEDENVDCPFHSTINTRNTFGWRGIGCKCFSDRCELNKGMNIFELIQYVEGVSSVRKWAASKGLIKIYKYNSGYELANKLNDFQSYIKGCGIWKNQ